MSRSPGRPARAEAHSSFIHFTRSCSMTVILHPKLTAPGQVRVWLGVTSTSTSPPNVTWSVGGQPAQPMVIRPLQDARTPSLDDGSSPRVYSGVFEFSAPPGALLDVTAVIAGEPEQTLFARSLPATLPND